jgi:ABC-type transport system involved in multi-copper enzyme maturation permease subunit
MRILLFLGICAVWLFIIFALSDYLQRNGAMEALVICLLIGGSVAVALMSASSFSRERESGTWESLRLSLLQPWTVVRSKWLSTLIAFGYYAAPFWILLPLGVTPWPRGQEPLQLLISLGILMTTLGATGAVGLWVSWRSRNTATATGLMLGGLIFCHLALPALWAQLNIPGKILGYPYYYSYQYSYYGDYDYGGPGVRLLLDTIEAPMVFETLTSRAHYYSAGSDVYQANLARETICMLFYAIVTGIFLWLVTRSVCHETRASSREGGSFIKTRLLPTLKYSRG